VSFRPTLAAHVAARRHVVAGEAFVILHDTRAGQVAKIGEREWVLLRCADGTRDLSGLIAAAAAQGRETKREHVEAFFAQLDRAGMLSHGIGTEPEPPFRPAAGQPVVPLPGFRLRCDGSGSCCRVYPTTSFSPLEVATARVHGAEVLDCGLAPDGVFSPEWGSTMPPWRAQAVTMVDGRCGFLSPAERCVLHEAGGAQAKPQGCRHFPATFVDDGEVVRISVAPECACVFRSALEPAQGGGHLVPPEVMSAGELAPSVFVSRVPSHLSLSGGSSAPGSTMVALGAALSRGLDDSGADYDAARLLWALAQELERPSVDPRDPDVQAVVSATLTQASRSPTRAPVEGLVAVAKALAVALDRRIDQDDGWRAEADLARRVSRWMAAAVSTVMGHGWSLEADQPAAELFYLQAVFHGHLWLTEDDGPLCDGLRRRALRLLVARAFAHTISADERAAEPALDYPLALVEAVSRGLDPGGS
jgi:lysine-N-methylase